MPVFPDTGVVDVQIEDDAELSPNRNSELGLEDERVTCPTRGGFAEILVVTLFLLTLTEHGLEDFERLPNRESTQFFKGRVFSEELDWTFSINLFSHGFAPIQRSNQLQPQLFLSNSRRLKEGAETFVCDSELVFDFHCCINEEFSHFVLAKAEKKIKLISNQTQL